MEESAPKNVTYLEQERLEGGSPDGGRREALASPYDSGG